MPTPRLRALLLTLACGADAALLLAANPFGWPFSLALAVPPAALVWVLLRWGRRARSSATRLVQAAGAVMLCGAAILAAFFVALAVDYRLVLFRPVGVDGWRADLRQLTERIGRTPRGLREHAAQRTLPMLAALDRDLASLDDPQRHARLIEAIAALDDGHSIAFPFQPATGLTMAPVRARFFSDGLFIVDAGLMRDGLNGAQIVRIAGRDVETAYGAMRRYIAANNESGARSWAPVYMLSPGLLHATGVIAEPGHLPLVVRTAGAAERHIDVPAVSMFRFLWWYLRPVELVTSPKPAYQLQVMPEARAVYVRFNRVETMKNEPLADFARRMVAEARAAGARRIVIDVRENSGGDNTLLPPFVEVLAASEFNREDGIAVLIGGGTFSAATNFVSLMERRTRAVFVGEPTGSGPNHYGDSGPFLLPRTRWHILLSTRRHQFGDPGDRRDAHEPHVRVTTSHAQFISGVDPVLAAALGRRAP